MAKNILATACYTVKNNYNNQDTEDYKIITDLCVESYRKNLQDIDDVIIFKGEVNNFTELFKSIYQDVRDLYFSGDNNILFVDSDTVCVKPTEIFGKFDEFMMFTILDRYADKYKPCVPKACYQYLKPWMFASVRYYPTTMGKYVWSVGERVYSKWIDTWAFDCILYNAMFHSQIMDRTCMSALHQPQYNFVEQHPEDMGIPIEDANIISLFASRGTKECIEKMNNILYRFDK